jgi:serine/threonine-protein kinase
MARDPRVAQLLEELLETGATPEEVCRTCPELLAAVQEGWRRLTEVQSQADLLFPPASPDPFPDPAPPGSRSSAAKPSH